MPPIFSRPPARIESLPVEIIQMIYLRALEPNLARASILIANAVSNTMFYDIFLKHAFWKPSRVCLSGPTGPFHVTQFIWVWNLYQTQQPYNFGERHFGHEKLLRIPLLRLFMIPNKLFRGPWDKKQTDLLETLYSELLSLLGWSRTRSVAEQSQLPRPTLDKNECFRGMEKAITEHQETTLLHFLRFLELLGSTKDSAGRICHPILPEHLYRSATLHHPADSTFLWRLIEASPTSLPDIPEIHGWAAAARDRGDPLGLSVLEILELNRLRNETNSNFCRRALGRILTKLVHILGSLGVNHRRQSRS
ncbi:hypothetical protein EYZ11_011654 [Aspergillus tanneri]|uniref:Uncharacterized protein n=1 Tax=Aspergillus tanneri TaxID=1220188 RepID=A0A4S3J4C8_9EURO|nr:hypothetical protein EYZ11_011654 [Aspergillus tanneri]